MLKLYNTLTRRKEEFVPLKENRKVFKCENVDVFTNSDVGFMRPGDLRIARCFVFLGGLC